MYCKNCGNEINPNAVACLSCGCDPRRGNKYCNGCGVQVNSEQVICIKCGVSLKNNLFSSEDGKSVAILSYLTLIGFVIAIIQHNANKTSLGAYHLRQAVGFMVSGIILGFVMTIISLPMLEMSYRKAANYAIFISILSSLFAVFLLVGIIINIINAANGVEKPAPVFGRLYEKWFKNIFN